MILKNNFHLIINIQKNIINYCLILVFFFIQISLNFLSVFSISQPYLMVIFLFLLINNSEESPSGIALILLGLFYDLITGTHLGVHSLFFYLIKNLSIFFEWKYNISKNYGKWLLFSLVYISTLLITKFVFFITIFKIPDIYSISFNLGCTLLLFPIISFIFDLPKFLLNFLSK